MANDAVDGFAEMSSVNQVLMSVVQGVVEVQDPPSQRCCFCILKKLTEAWGKTAHLFCCMLVQCVGAPYLTKPQGKTAHMSVHLTLQGTGVRLLTCSAAC